MSVGNKTDKGSRIMAIIVRVEQNILVVTRACKGGRVGGGEEGFDTCALGKNAPSSIGEYAYRTIVMSRQTNAVEYPVQDSV
jgi:hypothetical protein